MTAPLNPPTPPHGRPGYDPWQLPEGAHPDHHPGTERDEPLGREIRRAALTGLAVVVLGLLLGFLWSRLAPHVPLVSDGEAVYLKDTEGEQAIGADGTFALLALGFGVVTGLAAFLVHRAGGIAMVCGLAFGSLGGAAVAWQLGTALGPSGDVVGHARTAGQGVTFDAPLELGALGVLVAWPVAALLVHLGLTALFGPREEPQAHHWQTYEG
ncbi:AAA family ATPase [Streptomyces albidoflavus]|uniref:AAA family ATPase n=1 Tax=unclassified Streptomyces TaxID=2593676 RepID=UPI00211E18DB|nr:MULTISPECIES: AAA family ATPase [unclassified Streptomyces]MCQ9706244.1 AAA family ATPase [Streptomyces sp. BSP1]UYX96556.1 AAA family ATPase [Streptomyces sp. BI87]